MVVTKDKITRKMVRKTNSDLRTLKDNHKALEGVLIDLLSSVNRTNTVDNPVIIKLFDGISIEATFVPAHDKVLKYVKDEKGEPLTVLVRDNVKIKFKVTESYKDKIADIINK